MQRSVLLAALKRVAPALPKKAVDEATFAFDQEAGTVCASDGVVAAQAPVEGLPFSGCVLAEPLLAFLSGAVGEELTVAPAKKGEGHVFNCGGSKFKIVIEPLERRRFAPPDLSQVAPVAVPKGATEGLRVAFEASGAAAAGNVLFDGVVALFRDGKFLTLGSDGTKMLVVESPDFRENAAEPVPCEANDGTRFPEAFCKLLFTFKQPISTVYAHQDFLCASFEDGATVYTRQLLAPMADRMLSVFNRSTTKVQLHDLPAAFINAMQLAVAASRKGTVTTKVDIASGAVRVKTDNDAFFLSDVLDGDTTHGDARFSCYAPLCVVVTSQFDVSKGPLTFSVDGTLLVIRQEREDCTITGLVMGTEQRAKPSESQEA